MNCYLLERLYNRITFLDIDPTLSFFRPRAEYRYEFRIRTSNVVRYNKFYTESRSTFKYEIRGKQRTNEREGSVVPTYL